MSARLTGVTPWDRLAEELVAAGAIREPRIEAAFRAVRRHWFLPGVDLEEVYRDRAVITHWSADGVAVSSSSQPALMARMLGQLAVEPGMAVLEVGTGTGYNAALLGRLVGGEGRVITVDVDPEVTAGAARHLATAGAGNVTVVTGDGWEPPGERQRYDRIEATVGVWDVSPAWARLLRPGGVLVVPLWLGAGQQGSVAFRAEAGGRLRSTSVEPCGFIRMRGPGAGEATYHRIGRWTVTLDRADPERVRLLEDLLERQPSVLEVPPLDRGWFTAIALGQPDAVNLFSEDPVVWAGLLSVSPPGLAVVEAGRTIRTFGSHAPRERLLELVRRTPAVDLAQVAITAVPAGEAVGAGGAVATLARPNFTFVVEAVRSPPAV